MTHGSGYSQRGRIARAVLNEAAVRSMRMLDAKMRAAGRRGANTRELADLYNVGPETIRRILRWDSWKWVSEEGAGAEPHEWIEPAPGEIAASQERFLAKLAAEGLEVPGAGMEKLQTLAKAAARPEALLAELTGQLGSNGIPLGIPPVVGGTSTDGGSK